MSTATQTKASSARQDWCSAFYATIAAYQEVRSVIGTSGAIDYSQALLSPDTNLQAVGLVKPSLMDFVADVEITAKASLSEADYNFFRAYFVEMNLNDVPNTEAFRERSKHVSENVGRKLIARKIYPMSQYMRPVMVHINR